ncbi:hypothetical protein ACFW7O_00980, partial [Streptomyces diastatochromogenes]
MSTIDIETATMKCEVLSEGIALVEFSQAHEQNPFSRARMRELTRLMTDLDGDDRIRCVVLYGGGGGGGRGGGGRAPLAAWGGGARGGAAGGRATP